MAGYKTFDYFFLEKEEVVFSLGRFWIIPDFVKKFMADLRDFVAKAVALWIASIWFLIVFWVIAIKSCSGGWIV